MNEEENTFRALKDEELVVSSIWCYFGIHKWEQWSEMYKPNERQMLYIQQTNCVHCCKSIVRKVKLPKELE